MAKTITFRIKTVVDGKEQITSATMGTKELEAAFNAAKGSAGRFRDKLLTFNQGVLQIQSITGAVSQLAGTLGSITEESRSFGKAMREANTMAGKDAEGYEKLKDQVTELGKEIPLTRAELARGLYQVVSNGVGEEDWMGYLEASARSAVGGIADLEEVVKVTATVVKNYGMDWSAAGDIQDKIQLTAKNGVTSFEQLAAALPSVTGQAAQLGVSFEEMLGVMSTLTGVTGNTNEVATQLASVLTALTKESSKSQKMAEEMGISFNAASIKAAGGFGKFLNQLDAQVTAFAERSGQLRESIYSKLFGRAEAMRLITALTGQLKEKYDENVEALENSAGTMAQAYDNVASTGAAKLQILKNEWGEVTDAIQNITAGIQPTLNFAASLGMVMTSVITLRRAMAGVGIMAFVKSVRTAIVNSRLLGWVMTGTAVQTRGLEGALLGTAAAATTAKVAIRGLMAATVIGAVLAVLGVVLEKMINLLVGTGDEAEEAGAKMSTSAKAMAAAQEVYANSYSQTLAGLRTEYDKLQAAWKGLTSEQQKNTWIKQNQAAFKSLGLNIRGVKDAEDAFVKNTQKVVESLDRRAQATALESQLTEIYKQKNKIEDWLSQADAAAQARHRVSAGDKLYDGEGFGAGGGHTTKGGYEQVDRSGNWVLTQAGAARRNAVQWQANGSAAKQNRQALKDLERQAETTLAKMAELAKPQAAPGGNMPSPAGGAVGGRGNMPSPAGADGKKEFSLTRLDTDAIYEQEDAWAKGRLALKRRKDSYEAIDDALEVYRKRLQTATGEARVEVQGQIDKLEELRETMEAVSRGENASDVAKRRQWDKLNTRAQGVKQDYEIGIVGKEEAEAKLKAINDELAQMGLKPIEIDLDVKGADTVSEKLQNATSAIGQMGQSIAGLGSALELPELNFVGVLAQAIATMTLAYATATAQAAKLGPWAWIAFAATGLGELTTMISTVKQAAAFADGGVVSGPTYALVGEYAGARNNPEVIAPLDRLKDMIEPAGVGGGVVFRIEGRDLVGVLANETRVSSRSGRRTKIMI